ncbi:hypothetical protein, partial [Mesorhizobium sp. M8A.F.Ca.ET.218.01.1.1]|uniref:hypothetical protein n=1 Tax=Mesorhizobium sp. M8A.F.Ca.ET.218.01.1.1 TaxID=2563971 RepID=UPI001AEE9D72
GQSATAVPKRLPGRVHGRRALTGKVGLENKLFDKALVHFELDALVEFINDPDPVVVFLKIISGIIAGYL